MSPHRVAANMLIGFGWLLIGIFAPLVCSKRIVRTDDSFSKILRGAFWPGNLFRGRLRSSIPFVFISAALTFPMVWLAFGIGGVRLFKEGHSYLMHSFAFGYGLLGFVCLVTLLGCLLFRPYRFAGVACGYVAIVAMAILPIFPALVHDTGPQDPGPYDPSVDLLVLNPFMVGVGNSVADEGPQWFRYGPHSNIAANHWWLAGTLAYAALDVALLLCILVCYLTMRYSARGDAEGT